jgi:hypothetical protein
MSVTVAELKKLLDEHPGDALVVMASDAEGNEYSPLDEVTLEKMGGENRDMWPVHPEDQQNYLEGELRSCVVLWRV